jgi:hypothetical protein
MAEEETPPVDTGQAVETVPASLVSEDGSLADGWQQHAPEGYEALKEDKSLGTFKNVWDIGKSYVHVRKQVPVDKMPRPNDTWGDGDWDEFYKAGGRPETAADYNIKRHESIPEAAMPKEVIDGFQEIFFKYGASQKLVDAIIKYNNELALKAIQQQKDEIEQRNTQIWDQLHDKWGRAYDQRVLRAEKAVERGSNGDEGLLQRVLAEVNKSATLLEFVANIEDQFSENDPVPKTRIDTNQDLQQQIAEIEADPRYTNPDIKVRKPLFEKASRLRAQLRQQKQAV